MARTRRMQQGPKPLVEGLNNFHFYSNIIVTGKSCFPSFLIIYTPSAASCYFLSFSLTPLVPPVSFVVYLIAGNLGLLFFS